MLSSFKISLSFLLAASHLFAYSLASETKSKNPEWQAFYQQAKQEKANGQFLRAIDLLKKYISEANENSNERINGLIDLAILYWDIGDLNESNGLYASAAELSNNLGQKEKEEFALRAQEIYHLYQDGKSYRVSEQYEQSIQSFNKAISIAQEIHSPEHQLKCMRLLSLVYWDISDFDEFYKLNKEALEIAKEINHKKEIGRCLNNLGSYYYKIDNYTSALSSYETALKIAREEDNPEETANSLLNIGSVWSDIGNYEISLEYLKQALEIDRKLPDRSNIAKDLNNIGVALRMKGLTTESEESLNQAIGIFRQSLQTAQGAHDAIVEIQVLNNIGSTYSAINHFSEALEYFKLAASMAKNNGVGSYLGMIYNNIGTTYSNLGNFNESDHYYQEALRLASIYDDRIFIWETYLEAGNSYKEQGKYAEAIHNYENAIAFIEDIRSRMVLEDLKASYFGSGKRIEAYQNLIDLLIKLNRLDPGKGYDREAFNYLERAKARAFLDSLEVSKIDVSQGIDPLLANREKELMRDLSRAYHRLMAYDMPAKDKDELSEQIQSMEDQLQSLKREIRLSSPAYADLKYPEVITYEEARKELLRRGDAYLAFSIAKEASYAFVLSSTGLRIFNVPNRESLQKQVAEYRMALSDRQNKDFQLGRELFTELVGPGLEPGLKRLIIIPDDVLNVLPFETLLTNNDAHSWLIRDYMISYVPSLSSLRFLKQRYDSRPRPHQDLLAIGDATYRTNSKRIGEGPDSGFVIDLGSTESVHLSPLKYSALEVQNISRLFRPRKVSLLEREDATKRWLGSHDLTDYRIIHFATHSLIDDQRPARSAIVLSFNPDHVDDGLLQARDIYNLKMNTDLVTLSACQTGLGQFIRGEGIEGLSRAFFYAGTSSILMSLWSVNDQATCQLMELFYRHLRGGEPLTGALREAKLEMIHSAVLSHPYYWAAFIINGKTDSKVYSSRLDLAILLAATLGLGMIIVLAIATYRLGKL